MIFFFSSVVGHTNNIPCVDISPCGNFVCSVSIDQSIRIWCLNIPSYFGLLFYPNSISPNLVDLSFKEEEKKKQFKEFSVEVDSHNNNQSKYSIPLIPYSHFDYLKNEVLKEKKKKKGNDMEVSSGSLPSFAHYSFDTFSRTSCNQSTVNTPKPTNTSASSSSSVHSFSPERESESLSVEDDISLEFDDFCSVADERSDESISPELQNFSVEENLDNPSNSESANITELEINSNSQSQNMQTLSFDISNLSEEQMLSLAVEMSMIGNNTTTHTIENVVDINSNIDINVENSNLDNNAVVVNNNAVVVNNNNNNNNNEVNEERNIVSEAPHLLSPFLENVDGFLSPLNLKKSEFSNFSNSYLTDIPLVEFATLV
jgi:hypothetical protein